MLDRFNKKSPFIFPYTLTAYRIKSQEKRADINYMKVLIVIFLFGIYSLSTDAKNACEKIKSEMIKATTEFKKIQATLDKAVDTYDEAFDKKSDADYNKATADMSKAYLDYSNARNNWSKARALVALSEAFSAQAKAQAQIITNKCLDPRLIKQKSDCKNILRRVFRTFIDLKKIKSIPEYNEKNYTPAHNESKKIDTVAAKAYVDMNRIRTKIKGKALDDYNKPFIAFRKYCK